MWFFSNCRVAAQQYFGDRRFWLCTVTDSRGISGAGLREVVGMSIKDLTLDPEVADLVSAAFDRSWQFVKTDPELAHVDMDQKRAQLSRHLTHLAQSGERDLWRLANRAIGGLRREQNTAHWF